MFLHPARHFADAAPAPTLPDAATGVAGGILIAGTMVETASGWRDVVTLRAGDRVQTFDGGLCPLTAADPVALPPEPGRMAVRIAGGTFGACADLALLPGAQVLIRTAARLPEAARALVPALALRGLPGVTLVPLPGAVAAMRLAFADEEVIWANTGVLLHCPAPQPGVQFRALPPAEARRALAPAALFRRAG